MDSVPFSDGDVDARLAERDSSVSGTAVSFQQMVDGVKKYERACESIVPDDWYLVVRIDGKGFSKWTKPFEKPYDERIASAMVEAASDLVKDFSASIAYTASDEITIGMLYTVFSYANSLVY